MSETAIPEDIMDAAESIRVNYVIPDPAEVRLAIAEAILAERERHGWQPIETAPKDGTEILGYGAAAYKGREYAKGPHVIWWSGYTWDGRDPDVYVILDITHWAHLPSPPKP